jgi:hypothetical protein
VDEGPLGPGARCARPVAALLSRIGQDKIDRAARLFARLNGLLP